MKPLLEIRDVSLSYHTVSGETKALSNISFNLMPSEFLAVVGPSGCGKSTLLNLICGMFPAEEGTILMNGIPPSPGDPRIGYMLQKDHLLEWRNIYRNVLLGLEIRREKTPEKLAYIEEMLDTYGLNKFRTARPSQLSGGMRQRIMIAMAIMCNPRLIIADEPTTALDSITQRQIVDLLASLVDDSGASMLFITHDFAVLNHATTRCYVLADGRVAESGQTADILQSPHTKVASQLVTSARALSLRIDAETK